MQYALEALQAISDELCCPLCELRMCNPQTLNCGHTFCRECVVDTLEGPGIVKSQCPICKQPAWKKELKTNHKYLGLADAAAQLTALLQQQDGDYCSEEECAEDAEQSGPPSEQLPGDEQQQVQDEQQQQQQVAAPSPGQAGSLHAEQPSAEQPFSPSNAAAGCVGSQQQGQHPAAAAAPTTAQAAAGAAQTEDLLLLVEQQYAELQRAARPRQQQQQRQQGAASIPASMLAEQEGRVAEAAAAAAATGAQDLVIPSSSSPGGETAAAAAAAGGVPGVGETPGLVIPSSSSPGGETAAAAAAAGFPGAGHTPGLVIPSSSSPGGAAPPAAAAAAGFLGVGQTPGLFISSSSNPGGVPLPAAATAAGAAEVVAHTVAAGVGGAQQLVIPSSSSPGSNRSDPPQQQQQQQQPGVHPASWPTVLLQQHQRHPDPAGQQQQQEEQLEQQQQQTYLQFQQLLQAALQDPSCFPAVQHQHCQDPQQQKQQQQVLLLPAVPTDVLHAVQQLPAPASALLARLREDMQLIHSLMGELHQQLEQQGVQVQMQSEAAASILGPSAAAAVGEGAVGLRSLQAQPPPPWQQQQIQEHALTGSAADGHAQAAAAAVAAATIADGGEHSGQRVSDSIPVQLLPETVDATEPPSECGEQPPAAAAAAAVPAISELQAVGAHTLTEQRQGDAHQQPQQQQQPSDEPCVADMQFNWDNVQQQLSKPKVSAYSGGRSSGRSRRRGLGAVHASSLLGHRPSQAAAAAGGAAGGSGGPHQVYAQAVAAPLAEAARQQQQQQHSEPSQEHAAAGAPGSGRAKRRLRDPVVAEAAAGEVGAGLDSQHTASGRALRKRAKVQPPASQAARAATSLALSVVGKRVEVWWEDDQQYYAGRITHYNAGTGKHTVQYDDGEVETGLDMDKEVWRLEADSPEAQQQQQQPASVPARQRQRQASGTGAPSQQHQQPAVAAAAAVPMRQRQGPFGPQQQLPPGAGKLPQQQERAAQAELDPVAAARARISKARAAAAAAAAAAGPAAAGAVRASNRPSPAAPAAAAAAPGLPGRKGAAGPPRAVPRRKAGRRAAAAGSDSDGSSSPSGSDVTSGADDEYHIESDPEALIIDDSEVQGLAAAAAAGGGGAARARLAAFRGGPKGRLAAAAGKRVVVAVSTEGTDWEAELDSQCESDREVAEGGVGRRRFAATAAAASGSDSGGDLRAAKKGRARQQQQRGRQQHQRSQVKLHQQQQGRRRRGAGGWNKKPQAKQQQRGRHLSQLAGAAPHGHTTATAAAAAAAVGHTGSGRRPLGELQHGGQLLAHLNAAAQGTDTAAAATGKSATAAAAAAGKSATAAAALAAVDAIKPVVYLLGFDKEEILAYKQQLEQIGVAVATKVDSKYTTQLVARLDEHRRVQGAGSGRSLFHALLFGVPLVDIAWLTDSLAQGHMLPVDPYMAKGIVTGLTFDGGPARAIAAQQQGQKLFKRSAFVMAATDTQRAVQLDTLAPLITVGGGIVLKVQPGQIKAVAGGVKLCLNGAEFERRQGTGEGWRRLVVASTDMPQQQVAELGRHWGTQDVVTAVYVLDCIAAFQILPAKPYWVRETQKGK